MWAHNKLIIKLLIIIIYYFKLSYIFVALAIVSIGYWQHSSHQSNCLDLVGRGHEKIWQGNKHKQSSYRYHHSGFKQGDDLTTLPLTNGFD